MNTATINEMPWKDGKRVAWLLSPALPFIGLVLLAFVGVTGNTLFLWGAPFLFYGVIPLFDWLVGTDRTNPPESAVAGLENDPYYRWIVYAYIPSQYVVTVVGAWLAVSLSPNWWEFLGLVFTVGMVNGISINTAHELGHKKGSFERWLAKLTLAPVAYGHFFV